MHTVNVIRHYGGCTSSFLKLVFCFIILFFEYLSSKNVVYFAILRKRLINYVSEKTHFVSLSNKCCSLNLKYWAAYWVFNMDDNNKCVLSSRSAYYTDF